MIELEYAIAGAIGGAVVMVMLKELIEKKIDEAIGSISEKKNTLENPLTLPGEINIAPKIKQFPDEKEVDINELGRPNTSIDYSQPKSNKISGEDQSQK